MKRSNTQSLGEVINEFIAENKIGPKLKETDLVLSWEELLGKTINRYTKSVYIKDGTLFLEITSPVVKTELFMMRDEIIQRLNDQAGENLIRKVVFK